MMNDFLVCILCLVKMVGQFILYLIPMFAVLAIITKLINKKNWLSELLERVVSR